LKFPAPNRGTDSHEVAVFMTAWIEIQELPQSHYHTQVAVFMTAWIEMMLLGFPHINNLVAVFMTAWIEIGSKKR